MSNDNQTPARVALTKLIGENRDQIGAGLNDFWRRWFEDLAAAGLPSNEIAESMLVVAMVEAMKIGGATVTAAYLRGCAEKFEAAAAKGVEFPAAEQVLH